MRRVLAACVLLCALAACNLIKKGDTPSSPTTGAPSGPPAAGVAIHYTVLGASDANGIGGSSPCVPFDPCLNGTGYTSVFARSLRTSHAVTVTNLGLLTAVLSPTIQQIARANGRDVTVNIVERAVPFVPAETTLVTIFGGTNDVNSLVDAIEKGAAGSTDVKVYIDTQARAFGTDYDRAIRGVRDRAPGSFIIILNIPNLAALPFSNGYGLPRRQMLQYTSVAFNREANRQAAQGIVILDLMCDAQAYTASSFSSDGFHPNDAGYAYLAQRLIAIANGGSAGASASCSQMTVVPPSSRSVVGDA